jgi:hypothetical protein
MRKREIIVDGEVKVFRVKRLSDRHSTNVAKKFASRSRGYARKPKAHVTDIVSPKGLPTSSRIAGDERDGVQLSLSV